MTKYKALFDLHAQHAYFSDQRCKQLSFVATENSVKVMQNSGLIFQANQNVLNIQADQNNSETLMLFAQDLDDPFELQFKVYCSDLNFTGYTEPNAIDEKGIFYFEQRLNGQSQVRDATVHKEEWANKKDLYSVKALKEQGLLNSKDKLNPPCFIFSMVITEQAIKAFLLSSYVAPRFQIKFQAPKNIWKYYLMTAEDHQFNISDIDANVEFEPLGIENLTQHKKAIMFQSKTALNMHEKSNYHFQLVSTAESFSKVLINRLPVAKISQGYKKIIDGKAVSLSEIYINL